MTDERRERTRATDANRSRRPHSYLRPASPPPIRTPVRSVPVARLAPAFFLMSVVSVVLLGQGFWLENGRPGVSSGPMETITIPPDAQGTDAFGLPAPDSALVPPIGPLATGANSATYLARPAMPITNTPLRIETVPAKRDETVTAIAARRGVSVNALLWANGLTDPDAMLPVGLVIKVPPPGAMLHRIKETDTLDGIAKAYRVSVEQITAYPGNTVKQTGDLVPGEYLIVPTLNLPMRDKVVFYRVRGGDSLSKIASFYGLRDPQTLQWANNLNDVNVVQPTQVIAIPPIDGVILVVKSEDAQGTTEEAITRIAKGFACTAIPCQEAPSDTRIGELRDAVFSFGPNHLARTGRLIPGQELVIPGGIPYVAPPPVIIPPTVVIDNVAVEPPPPAVVAPKPPVTTQQPAVVAPKAPVTTQKPVAVPTQSPSPGTTPAFAFPGQFPSIYYPGQGVGSGRNPGFVWPETGAITSTYNPAHNGIDIATPANTPLHAAAAGYVVYAGWTDSGLGNAVYIDHGNGFVTVYGHMNGLAVKVGQYVQKGEYIGPEGSTGNSTGPHVHFMVIENNRSVNPFNYLP